MFNQPYQYKQPVSLQQRNPQTIANTSNVRVRQMNQHSPPQNYEAYDDRNYGGKVAQFNQQSSSVINGSLIQSKIGTNNNYDNKQSYSTYQPQPNYGQQVGSNLYKNPSNYPYNVISKEPYTQINTQSRGGVTEIPRVPSSNYPQQVMNISNIQNNHVKSSAANQYTPSIIGYSNGSSTASSNKNSLTASNSSQNSYERNNLQSRNYLSDNQSQQTNQLGSNSNLSYNQGSSSLIGGYTPSTLSYNAPSQSQILKKVSNRKCGLHNIGNTCYMNSALQCVFNIPGFLEIFISGKYRSQINSANKGVADEFADLAKRIEEPAGKYSAERPSMLKRAIERVNQQFYGSGQQDSQEFLRTLLDGLHNDLNRVQGKKPYRELEANTRQKSLEKIGEDQYQYYLDRDNSIVTDFFTGQLMSKVTCQTCHTDSMAFDNFMDLSLSFTQSFRILNQNDLDRLMQAFLKEETLDDTYYCKTCKKHMKSKRQLFIWRLPDVLVIHLKRFHFGTQRREKINLSISFPIKDLNMGKYLERQKNQEILYDLIGVVNHSGSLYGGHYTAQCRNPHDSTWNEFNDSSWNEININSQQYDKSGSSEPYLLFYCKKSLLQKYQQTK